MSKARAIMKGDHLKNKELQQLFTSKPIARKCFDQARYRFTELSLQMVCSIYEEPPVLLLYFYIPEWDRYIFSHLSEDICQTAFFTYFSIWYFPFCGLFLWEFKLSLGYSNETSLLHNVNSRHWGMDLSSVLFVLHLTLSSATEYLMTFPGDA